MGVAELQTNEVEAGSRRGDSPSRKRRGPGRSRDQRGDRTALLDPRSRLGDPETCRTLGLVGCRQLRLRLLRGGVRRVGGELCAVELLLWDRAVGQQAPRASELRIRVARLRPGALEPRLLAGDVRLCARGSGRRPDELRARSSDVDDAADRSRAVLNFVKTLAR